jgi:hypothetical protein
MWNVGNIDSIIFGYRYDSSNSKYKEFEDADMQELLENFVRMEKINLNDSTRTT